MGAGALAEADMQQIAPFGYIISIGGAARHMFMGAVMTEFLMDIAPDRQIFLMVSHDSLRPR